MGEPDGFVERETHQIDWYGEKSDEAIQECGRTEETDAILRRKSRKIPIYDDKDEIGFGQIAVNSNSNGCGMCITICPANSLILIDKKCQMTEPNQ